MTRGTSAAAAAFITLAFGTPAMAQGGCWKSTDSTKMYGYPMECAAPAKATRTTRVDEKGTQANAMQISMNGGPGQCWKGTDSTKIYGYWHACK